MARPKQPEPPKGGTTNPAAPDPAAVIADRLSAPVSALSSRDGRTWLALQLGIAELDLKQGPKQLGWAGNEALRPALTEHVEFLRALNALVSSIPA
jgi:hypothetical protein